MTRSADVIGHHQPQDVRCMPACPERQGRWIHVLEPGD